jgi:hypothetical protein
VAKQLMASQEGLSSMQLVIPDGGKWFLQHVSGKGPPSHWKGFVLSFDFHIQFDTF